MIVNGKSPQGYAAYISVCVCTLRTPHMHRLTGAAEMACWATAAPGFYPLRWSGQQATLLLQWQRNFRWCQASLLLWPGLKLFAAMLCHNLLAWDQLPKAPNNLHLYTHNPNCSYPILHLAMLRIPNYSYFKNKIHNLTIIVMWCFCFL